METRDLKLGNGNIIHYKVSEEGTCYEYGLTMRDGAHEDYNTSDSLIYTLEACIKSRSRVRVWYGDRQNGEAWMEEYGVTGYIERSTGEYKSPLLVHNSRSYGGEELLVGHIIRIDDIKSHRTLYEEINFHLPSMRVMNMEKTERVWTGAINARLPYSVIVKSKVWASFETEEKAKHWIEFMRGQRYSK